MPRHDSQDRCSGMNDKLVYRNDTEEKWGVVIWRLDGLLESQRGLVRVCAELLNLIGRSLVKKVLMLLVQEEMGFLVPWAPDLFRCKYWIAGASWPASIYNCCSWCWGNTWGSRGGRRLQPRLSCRSWGGGAGGSRAKRVFSSLLQLTGFLELEENVLTQSDHPEERRRPFW